MCSFSLSQACWEPAEAFGWEDPIKIRYPSLLHASPVCLAKLLLQTRLFPSALCRSNSCLLVPSISLLAASPVSQCLPSCPTHWLQWMQQQRRKPPSFVCFCGFLPVLRTEEHFLLPGRRGNWLCVVMDSVPSFLCSDRPCFAIVSF